MYIEKFIEFFQINVINYFIALVGSRLEIYEVKCARNLKELKMIKAERTRDRNVPCESNQNGT